jgi:hypothetical protein
MLQQSVKFVWQNAVLVHRRSRACSVTIFGPGEGNFVRRRGRLQLAFNVAAITGSSIRVGTIGSFRRRIAPSLDRSSTGFARRKDESAVATEGRVKRSSRRGRVREPRES